MPARLQPALSDVEEKQPTGVAPALQKATEPTVLEIDDDATAVDLLSRALQGAGMRVVSTDRGSQALELARTLRPDAITLDVLMPGMDGWEVLRTLKDIREAVVEASWP